MLTRFSLAYTFTAARIVGALPGGHRVNYMICGLARASCDTSDFDQMVNRGVTRFPTQVTEHKGNGSLGPACLISSLILDVVLLPLSALCCLLNAL